MAFPKKVRFIKFPIILIMIILIILSLYLFLRLVKPSRKFLIDCQSKVEVWSNDCYKTCKPHSDSYTQCKTSECSNQASILLNYCSERCRAFTEAEKNKCYLEFEDTNLIRKLLKKANL